MADHAAEPPLVSVVIPVLNERRHIEACLASVFAQTYAQDRTEIIVADGGSDDGTVEIVRRLAARHPTLRLIANPDRIQAAGLNRAIAVARGEVIARLDGHAAWRPHHLARCVQLLEETGAANVGGGMVVEATTAWTQAIGRATASPFGVGGARYRWARRQQDVDTVWLGCFRRGALEAAGLYDPGLDVHEDYELNQRIRARGGRIVFSPDLDALYRPRESLTALARQFFRYGRAKARVARRTPQVMRPHHLVPPLAVAAALPIAVSLPTSRGRAGAALVAGYATACVAAGVAAGRGCPLSVGLRIPVVFPILHGAWGCGFWAGLLGPSPRRQSSDEGSPVNAAAIRAAARPSP